MNVVEGLIDEVKKDATGLAILSEWLGSGGRPVEQSAAEARAALCKLCPQNVEMGWWDRVKHAIAETIKTHLQVQNKIGLHVTNEQKLGICRMCGCCLPLKVWVPVEHVKAHTTNVQIEAAPSACWIVNEIRSMKAC